MVVIDSAIGEISHAILNHLGDVLNRHDEKRHQSAFLAVFHDGCNERLYLPSPSTQLVKSTGPTLLENRFCILNLCCSLGSCRFLNQTQFVFFVANLNGAMRS
ncbi:MAG: hypothetical protein ACK58N_06015, partial [Synechocystis sp.]